MSDDEIIEELSNRTDMIHVDDPGAYEAFARGKVIFDISPSGYRLDAFIVTLEPEFGAATVSRQPFAWPTFPDVKISTVYHKHATVKQRCQSLGKLRTKAKPAALPNPLDLALYTPHRSAASCRLPTSLAIETL